MCQAPVITQTLKAAALLSLCGPTLLVAAASLTIFPLGLLLAAAYAWYCWSFLRSLGTTHGLGRAMGTGLLTVLVMLAGAAAVTDGFDSDHWKQLILAALLVLVPAAMVAAAVKSYHAAGRESGNGWTLAGGLAVSLLYGIMVLASAAVGLPGILQSRLASNQAAAVNSIRAVHACAAAYNSQFPDRGYPADLAALGPSQAKCVEPQLASGKQRGYQFVYTPGRRDDKGHNGTYSITARPAKYRTTGATSFFSDSTQLIHLTRENRPATTEDSPTAP